MKLPTVALLAVAGLLSLAALASADAPTREVIAPGPDATDAVCGFPVLIHSEGTTIRKTFTDNQGRVVRQIETYPGFRLVLTNVDTGESVTARIPGPLKLTFNPDGTTTFQGTGPWGWLPTHPGTGEPGIFLLYGHIHQTIDVSGNVITTTFQGHTINVCDQLAP
jgi:hypothetical protein